METHWGWVEAVGVIEMSPGFGIAREWGGLEGGVGEVVEGKESIGGLTGVIPRCRSARRDKEATRTLRRSLVVCELYCVVCYATQYMNASMDEPRHPFLYLKDQ